MSNYTTDDMTTELSDRDLDRLYDIRHEIYERDLDRRAEIAYYREVYELLEDEERFDG